MVADHPVLLFGSLLLCVFLLHRILRVKQVWQAFGDLPAYSRVVSPLEVISRVIPRIPPISDGTDFSWENVYERQTLPRVRPSYPAHGPYTSRCLRKIQVRRCSTAIDFPVRYPSTASRRRYSC